MSALHRHHRHLVSPSQLAMVQTCGVYAMFCPGVSGACLREDACNYKLLLMLMLSQLTPSACRGRGREEEEGGCLSGVATQNKKDEVHMLLASVWRSLLLL